MITAGVAEKKTVKTAQLFGEIAISKGYVTETQLTEALTIQHVIDSSDEEIPHQRIGDILYGKGWITVEQIYDVQLEIFNQKREESDSLSGS